MESIVLSIYLWFKTYFLVDTNAKMWTEITDLVIFRKKLLKFRQGEYGDIVFEVVYQENWLCQSPTAFLFLSPTFQELANLATCHNAWHWNYCFASVTHTVNWIFKIVKVVFLTSKVQLLLFQKKCLIRGIPCFYCMKIMLSTRWYPRGGYSGGKAENSQSAKICLILNFRRGGGWVLWSQNWKYSKCQDLPKCQFF